MDIACIESLTIKSYLDEAGLARAESEERVSDRQLARFRTVIANPDNLAYFHADATIALLPVGDAAAIAGSLMAARRARRRHRSVQFLFCDANGANVIAPSSEFLLDLREATWGPRPQGRLAGYTAADIRTILSGIIADEQIWGPRTDGREDRAILNGSLVLLLEDHGDGRYSCIAPAHPAGFSVPLARQHVRADRSGQFARD